MASSIHISPERAEALKAFTQGVNLEPVRKSVTANLLTIEAACLEVASTEQERRYKQESGPVLTPPGVQLKDAFFSTSDQAVAAKGATVSTLPGNDMPGSPSSTGFNANASLLEALVSLRQLLSEGKLSDLRNRLVMLNAETDSLREHGEKLLTTLEGSIAGLQEAKDALGGHKQAYQESKNELTGLEQQHNKLQTQLGESNTQLEQTAQALTQARDELAAMPSPPKTEAQKQQFKQLSQNVATLENRLQSLQSNVQQLSGQITGLEMRVREVRTTTQKLAAEMNQAADIVMEKTQQADQNREQLNQLIKNAPRSPQIDGERWEDALTMLTLLTAELKKILNEDGIKNMRQHQRILEIINESTRKDSEKKAKEAEEASRKAAEASKSASCISKIIGGIVTAISVIVTVASFGTATPVMAVVAAIGLAMTTADVVLEATGQSTIMEMLATEISKGMTEMLIKFGVPEEDAKEIGGYLGMVLAAIAILAVSLFSLASFAKNGAKVGMDVAKSASKFAKSAGNVVVRKVEIGLHSANLALNVSNTAISGGLNIHSANMMREMKTMLAGMLLNNAAITVIDELLKDLFKAMAKTNEQITTTFESMLSALNDAGQTRANMMKTSFA
ncbi:type III secretion system translocon subunit SctE [Enterobacter mori]|uniref:type III secretion system translocon subunit SctE n=1 Tax=Enterobacter mori TaxID=539813 RepID=UPI001B8AB184|nr:type III secretion system translocon subunit SctE [Enterobacter mori]MBS3050402.1 YopB/SseC family type III secretion system translocon subunit [Enterobacter mori]